MQAVEHFLLGFGQVGNHSMQEEGRLVEQPLGRFDVLDHNAARKLVELCVFIGSEFASREYHYRQILQLGRIAKFLQHLEAGHVGQAQIDDAAIEALGDQRAHSRAARADTHDFDVVVRQQVDDARALQVVVLDDQQAPHLRRDVRLQPVERALEIDGRRRLHEVREGAVRQPVLLLFLDREHLHGNVPRGRVELQVVEHRPPQHVGQEHVEGDRRGTEFPGQREAGLSAQAWLILLKSCCDRACRPGAES